MSNSLSCSALCLPAFALLGIVACKGEWQGRYLPACTAHAGHRIVFADGEYRWERFTDAVRVVDGEPVDPYPDFPRQGRYRRDGDAIQLLGDQGETLATWHLVRQGGDLRLLGEADYADWRRGGELADCALILVPDGQRG